MQIEILLAVYNGEKFIEDQIKSIFDQDYQNFKLVIRDNCSTDGTLKIIEKFKKKFPEQIVILHSSINLGCIDNFSKLAEYSTAEYVMFCDCDDIWLPNKISLSLLKMQENEKIYGKEMPLLVHTDLKVVDSSLKLLQRSFWKMGKAAQGFYPLGRQLVQNTITGNTIRKK